MRDKYKNALMWGLYAVLFLFAAVFQTVIFGRPRFYGVKLSLLPVVIGCVTMHTGSENGAVYGLAAGLFWALTGADTGALFIVLFAVSGAVCGYLCDRYLKQHFVSALLMALLALLLCQLPVFAVKCYLGSAFWQQIGSVFVQVGLSMAAFPVIYLISWAVRKVGV